MSELGVLYKDVALRAYSLTPRAALIDRLGASTGLGVPLVGMIGLNAQIFRGRGGDAPLATAPCGGRQARLHETACCSPRLRPNDARA